MIMNKLTHFEHSIKGWVTLSETISLTYKSKRRKTLKTRHKRQSWPAKIFFFQTGCGGDRYDNGRVKMTTIIKILIWQPTVTMNIFKWTFVIATKCHIKKPAAAWKQGPNIQVALLQWCNVPMLCYFNPESEVLVNHLLLKSICWNLIWPECHLSNF